jgi:EAL domain-containing protein (putative c-di-GMP-specific phosphodiesterase class I)/ActR/RegA family two-component response regulator
MGSNICTTYVLDDEAAIGAIVCRVLNDCGHTTLAFEEPRSFISKIESDPPQLIMLDLALGRSDAIEVIRALEGLGYQGDVILMSGRDAKVLAEITQIGASRGLSMLPPIHKPFTASELRLRLQATPKQLKAAVQSEILLPRVDLVEAIDKRWLQLWYQPKIDLKTLSICGAEGLLRIRHPEFGVVPPGQFLPEAGNALYHSLSTFVIVTAISDWKTMATLSITPKISINVPASVMLDPAFVAGIRAHLPKDRTFPGLTIEVTEEEMVRDVQLFREVAFQLGLSSIDLSIDDFGTAHSSLSRLKNLPFREIKLDRSFVSNCSVDEDNRNICRTIVELAKRFKVVTCAEGVETAEDLKALTSMGFDTVQGYLFAKAMPLEAFIAVMRSEALHSPKDRLPGGISVNGAVVNRPTALGAYSTEAIHADPRLPPTF